MNRLEVSTVVYLPPEEIHEFLLSFENYAEYSEREEFRPVGTEMLEYALEQFWEGKR